MKIKIQLAVGDRSNIKFVLIFGNESNGISKSVSKFLSHKITIPRVSNSSVDSLNITSATAIIMNEISNQSFKS